MDGNENLNCFAQYEIQLATAETADFPAAGVVFALGGVNGILKFFPRGAV